MGFFRNVALQVARVSYSSTEGTKPINKRFYKVTWQSYGGGEMTKRNNLVIQVQQKLSTENNLVFAAIIMFKTW